MSAIARSVKAAKNVAPVVAALGALIASSSKKNSSATKKSNAKKKKNNKKQVSGSHLTQKNHSIPVAVGTAFHGGKYAHREHPFDFDTLNDNYIIVKSGVIAFGDSVATNGTYNFPKHFFDLNPTIQPKRVLADTDLTLAPLGLAVANLARAYSEYKIERLTVEYVPLLSTGANGSVVIGYSADPFTNISTVPKPQFVSELQPSLTVSTWARDTMNVTPFLNKQWLHTVTSSDVKEASEPSEQRSTCFGSIIVNGIGLGAGNVTGFPVGYLRFRGRIVFRGVFNTDAYIPAHLPVGSSSSSSHESESTDQRLQIVDQTPQVHLEPKLDEMTGKWYIPTVPSTPAQSSSSSTKKSL